MMTHSSTISGGTAPGRTTLDRLLVDGLELAVLVFGSWTLAYELILVSRLPARLVVLPTLAIALPLVWFWYRGREKETVARASQWTEISAALVAATTAMLALLLARPDLDDFSFFHRAVAQIGRFGQPFIIADTSHDILLPPLSNHHLLTSYEPLVALAAHLLGLDPILLYHNGTAFFAGLALAAVWMMLYRHVGLGWRTTLVATATALAFHLLDGGPQRSFGHFGLVRLWHGKVILVTVLLPLVILFALRFLAAPSRRGFGILAMAAISGVGLSSSAIFLIPTLTFAIGAAYVISSGGSKISRGLTVQLAAGFCTALGVALWLGWLPRPNDSSIWNSEYPSAWWDNLALVVGSPTVAIRDLLLVILVPILSLARPFRILIPMLSVILVVVFVNPWTGPLWLAIVESGAYWRFAFLFPVTWCAGLLPAAIARPSDAPISRNVQRAAITISVIMLAIGFPGSVLRNPTAWHSPWGYKLGTRPLTFAKQAVDFLEGRRVLAPPGMVVLTLLDPSIKLEAGRPFQTLHAFRNIGRENEGNRRLRAQEVVSGRPINPRREQAFLRSLELGTNALVVRRPALTRISKLLQGHDLKWRISANTRGYVLLLPIEDKPTVHPTD